MSFIVPVGWTRHQGFPQITGSAQGTTLVDEFYASYDLIDIYNKLPDYDSLYDNAGIVPDLLQLRLSEQRITPTANKANAIITLTYQPSSSSISTEEGIADYYLENNMEEIPIEKAKTPEQPTAYLVKWNYRLYQFIDIDIGTTSVPAWWTSATDQSDATGERLEDEYMWAKEKPSGGYIDPTSLRSFDWKKVKDATKPGVESFLIPAPTVQERKHYKSKKSASTAAATVGTKVTPDETYGKTNGEWLVMSASLQKDGKRYLVERSFQWLNSWDTDLYA